ncbi:MAG: hypothetical protein KA059_04600 [Elusimicrobiales bacterium]|jgi:curli biogenesis system outer membrane secretion channel CsgG|nr:hypothetical protein [Elusimicrobiales bacterium]NLH40100.1 hypothetical protein [Elusimicrobiota bacterium]
MKRSVIILSFFLFSCVSPQVAVNKNADFSKVKRVAVLTFNGPEGTAAADILTTTLLKHGADVIERQQIDSVIKELNLSQSGMINIENTRKIGQLLSIDAIILGTVTNLKPSTKYLMQNNSNSFNSLNEIKGKNIYIQNFDPTSSTTILETTAEVGLSVRMVDIETGSIMWSAYMNWEGLDTTTTMQTISEYFIKSLSQSWKAIVA